MGGGCGGGGGGEGLSCLRYVVEQPLQLHCRKVSAGGVCMGVCMGVRSVVHTQSLSREISTTTTFYVPRAHTHGLLLLLLLLLLAAAAAAAAAVLLLLPSASIDRICFRSCTTANADTATKATPALFTTLHRRIHTPYKHTPYTYTPYINTPYTYTP